MAAESFGRRVAKQRAELGWTQAQLAERVAMSRVALSHIEANLSVASERTVTLLAGVFGCEPCALAAGTDYPPAKAERLPLVTARRTEVDHQLAVLDAVLATVARVPVPQRDRLRAEVRSEWRARLADLLAVSDDPRERRRVRAAQRFLANQWWA
jgi:transcriptional regulator with XRE-family HTH domain